MAKVVLILADGFEEVEAVSIVGRFLGKNKAI